MPKLAEWHIYGNEQQGRFSVRKPENEPLYYLDALTTDVTNKNFFRILDKKEYELKDHLGNVRVAIGDMKIPTLEYGQIRFYVDEKSVSDFYPGGMAISDRSWQSTDYRYGYNGQEKSLEIDASGNHHTAEFWEVNNASLRRWNRDPKPTVGISEYSIFGDNPILMNDLKGDLWGVSVKFVEGEVGTGLSAYWNEKNTNNTLNMTYQDGTAQDDIGKTFFRLMKTNANLNGQAPYSSQDIIIGASVTESLGIAYFWKAKTFEDILKITSYSTPLPKFGLFNKLKIGTFFSLGVGFGDGVVSVQGGLGFGIKFSSINMELVRSISITDKEANKLITGTFTSAVGLTTPQLMLDKEGNKTGFKAELLAVDKKRQI